MSNVNTKYIFSASQPSFIFVHSCKNLMAITINRTRRGKSQMRFSTNKMKGAGPGPTTGLERGKIYSLEKISPV